MNTNINVWIFCIVYILYSAERVPLIVEVPYPIHNSTLKPFSGQR